VILKVKTQIFIAHHQKEGVDGTKKVELAGKKMSKRD
jgi:hypothetical protein